MIIIVIIYLLQ